METSSAEGGGRRPSERFRTLPAPVRTEDLRELQDAEPSHGELDDGYREQTWTTNSTG
jgi:hypothetical protein